MLVGGVLKTNGSKNNDAVTTPTSTPTKKVSFVTADNGEERKYDTNDNISDEKLQRLERAKDPNVRKINFTVQDTLLELSSFHRGFSKASTKFLGYE